MKRIRKSQKVKSEENDKPVTDVTYDKAIRQGMSAMELPKPVAETSGPTLNTLPFLPSNFKPGLKVLCLLPVVPGLFTNYSMCMQSTPKKQKMEDEEKVIPLIKTEYDETIVTENIPSNLYTAQVSVHKKSLEDRKTNDATKKDNMFAGNAGFDYKKLLKNLSLVKKPNQFWGVTPTDKFTIFSRWNEKYIPEKRIVIDNSLNSKVFLGDLEINAMNLMDFSCVEDVSALLEKVENVKFCGKEPVINHCS